MYSMNNKITIKYSLEYLLAQKRKANQENLRCKFVMNQMEKFGVKPIEQPLAVALIRPTKTAAWIVKNTLKSLGLENEMEVKLIQGTVENLKKLNIASTYITYGIISQDTLRELITKRGFVNGPKGEKIQITGNKIVKDAFEGKVENVECVEDLVDEFYNFTNLDVICKVLASFQLTRREFRNIKSVKVGGNTGFRDDMDNWLLTKL